LKVITINKSFTVTDVLGNNLYSFVNPASINKVLSSNEGCNNITYFCDGILMAKFFEFFTGEKIQRISFDNTSIAKNVFEYASLQSLPIYIIGAKDDEVVSFVNKITNKYENVKVSGYSDGYFSNKTKESVVKEIIDSKTKIVIIGLGAGKQEEFMLFLKKCKYSGSAFSCGGFIRQESDSKSDYYPIFFDKYNLRFLFRMYKEPHTIKRYFLLYPINLIVLFISILFKFVRINVRD
jgi:exopolysaccharide biosynthesis WecB/TagA/CpsF family protein